MNKKITLFSLAMITFFLPALSSNDQDEKLDPEDERHAWIKTTADIISMVDDKGFRKEVTFAECMQDALKAYLAKIDAHTCFFTAKGHQSMKDTATGKFSGIGVSITGKSLEDDSLVLVDVVEGGPAEKAGLLQGDKIYEVDGFKLQGLSSDEAIGKIKGKLGTFVKLKIIRGKKPLEFKVKRDVVKDEPSIWYRFQDHDIYYCALKIFNEPAAQQMKSMIKKMEAHPCKGLIIDLRNNPGGILESAIDIAALFVPKGSTIVTTKNNKNLVMNTYKTNTDPIIKKAMPIFIITNNFTASAAEILTGCLTFYAEHSNNRQLQVFSVGTKTHGKGSVQEVIPVGQGCAMKLTTMLYYLPNNISIQAVGIEPDFLVKPKTTPEKELKWIEETYGRETSMKNHITPLEIKKIEGKPITKEDEAAAKKENTKKESVDPEDDADITTLTSAQREEKRQKDLSQNLQIQTCINMINMLALAHKASPEEVVSRKKAIIFLQKNFQTDNPTKLELIK